MKLSEIFEPSKTNHLIGHTKNFNFLKDLLNSKKFPKV